MIGFRIRGGGTADVQSLFLTNLTFIERIARSVAHHHGFYSAEADDFCSHVKTRFLEDDYSILRKYEGRCSLPLYIKTVIHRIGIDYEISLKGKWRASTTAQKIGPMAVQLEELLYNKHHTFEEACQILNSRHGRELQQEMLREIETKLPKRWGKTTVHLVPLNETERFFNDREHPDPRTAEKAEVLGQILNRFVRGLSGADRLILKMRFEDDFTFDQIARLIKKTKLQVYWRLRKVLSDLQGELISHRLSADTIREITEYSGKTIDVDFLNASEQNQECPSNEEAT